MLLLFCGIMLYGCEPSFDPEKCTEENRVEIGLEQSQGLENCRILTGDSYQDRNLVIRSQNEFSNQMNCVPEIPTFNFDEYFILTGSYTHHKCASLISESAYLCNGNLVYEVRIEETLCTAPTTVTYQTTIDNKYKDLKIIFDIKIIKNEI